MIPWLGDVPDFPPLEQALTTPNGLLAAGGALSPEWLLAAYRRGIFPWFNAGEPILWWSPDPRLILVPGEIRISRSLRKRLRSGHFELRFDSAFAAVVQHCAAPRPQRPATWISPRIAAAYTRMHELGHAHSVESWRDGKLVGGLYGIALGRVFFGESMFALEPDASKVALVHLAALLERLGYGMIDCQMTTAHLQSMGAREISRAAFAEALAQWMTPQPQSQHWAGEAGYDPGPSRAPTPGDRERCARIIPTP